MSWIDGLRHRLHALANPAAHARETDEEVAMHLELDAMHQGNDARARRRFGNSGYYKEERRRAAGLHLFDGMVLDCKHLLRSLLHSKGFAATVVLTLALGIAVTTAVVSVADHVLVRSLAFGDSSRLMMMLERDPAGAIRVPSAPTVADWKRDSGAAQAFEGLTYIRGDGVTLRVGEETETVGTGFVEPEFFPLLRVRPRLGRLLLPDDHAAAAPVVVMSHRLWQRRFGGDPGIVGRTISVDSIPTTVVGVLPVGAVYPGFADLWQPISQYRHREILLRRGFHADSRTLGRLRAGVDSTRAIAFMRTIGARLATQYPAEQAGWMPGMVSVRAEIVGDVGPMLWTLAFAAGAVLLLACANVAGLLLARVTARTRELALRSAIGASRARVVRQLMTESLILAAIGGVAGAALAIWTVGLSRSVLADRLPRMDELSLDWRVLSIAAATTLLTALVCGVWPALRATRTRSAEVLRASTLGAVGGRGEARLRRALVTLQFAVALVLLVGAGLLVQSFRRVARVDIGFDPAGMLTFRVGPPPGAYATPQQAAALYERLMNSARAVPGVVDAAFINHFPFGRAAMITTLTIDGRSSLDSSNQIFYRTVSANYLRTMGMSMVRGRWFSDDDMRGPGGSFVINETMAKNYWSAASAALGQRITVTRASQARPDFGQPLPGTIVGVVADVRQGQQDVAPTPEVYVPYTLETWPWGMLVIRSHDGARAIPALVRAVRSVDSRLVADGVTGARAFSVTRDAISASLEPRRFSIRLIGAFALCALALAAIGMYGVVAYSIAQRTREIGVRKALGATNATIVRDILRESAMVVGIGAALGALGAWSGARLIRSMLFDTSVADVTSYLIAIGLLASVAMIATYIPARRATALDPALALRGD
jgi:putative ABC transport system permease protein